MVKMTLPQILSVTEEDVHSMLAAQVHLGTKVFDFN